MSYICDTMIVSSPAKKRRLAGKRGARKTSKPTHPPTLEMITRAIAVERDPKGTSVMAIKKHIMANNRIKSAALLNHMLRRAFEAGLAAGKLTRPKSQLDIALLAGRYRLAPVKAKKPKTAVAKPKKVAKKVAKSPAKKTKSPAMRTRSKKARAKSSRKPAAKKVKPAKKPAAKRSLKKRAPAKTGNRTTRK